MKSNNGLMKTFESKAVISEKQENLYGLQCKISAPAEMVQKDKFVVLRTIVLET